LTWVRPKEEIEQALEIQRQALISSSAAYDRGDTWEALRLATSVYVIVHDDGRKYQSVLTQLGIRGKLRFASTAFQYSPTNVLRETHLLSTRVYSDGTAEYRPLLGGAAWPVRYVQFNTWWDRERIFRDGAFSLTRKKLAYMLRSREGGAHLEPVLRDPNYLRFAQAQLTTPFVFRTDGPPPKPILGAELASMRQIAWELLKTLEESDARKV
jgi:hypothetical protein